MGPRRPSREDLEEGFRARQRFVKSPEYEQLKDKGLVVEE